MCSPEAPKSSKEPKGNQNLCAWITIVGTFLFILCLALLVFLKVGISENQETGNSEITDLSPSIQLQGGDVAVPVQYDLARLKRKKICKANTCGVGASCWEGKCACKPKHAGDPTTKCEKLECVENNDCESNQACYKQKCINPCANACAGQNAKCDVINHVPVCFCPAGYTGNAAFEDCKVIEPETANDNQTDVCLPSPCGPNATCSIFQGLALCSYQYIPPSEFRTTTSKPQHECESDEECDSLLACRDYKCVSPCRDCGLYAICKKSDHSAICKCPRGYSGDPYDKCSPECEQDADCPSARPACVEHSCADPCYGACGINARCAYRAQRPVCSCPRHTAGDSLVFCRPAGNSVDNFCDPNPCGANATCILSSEYYADYNSTDESDEDYPVCICPAGYVGNPRTSCEESECDEDSDCDDSLACLDNECVDPCLDEGGESVCGVGADCESRRHLATCFCLEGLYGDPFTGCYGGGGGSSSGGGGGNVPSALIASLLG